MFKSFQASLCISIQGFIIIETWIGVSGAMMRSIYADLQFRVPRMALLASFQDALHMEIATAMFGTTV